MVKLVLKNMRKELIARHELMSQLREQGILRLEDVSRAYIAGDGTIRVIKVGEDSEHVRKKRRAV